MTSPQNGSSRNLPNTTPCLSYWQRTTRGFPHLFANRNNPVPPKAKYVVIGSGISGALAAFELLETGVKAEDVVILEAREAASGASSRNAGHVRPGMSFLQTKISHCYGSENDQGLQMLTYIRRLSGLQRLLQSPRARTGSEDYSQRTTCP